MADIRAGRVATIPANAAFAPGAAMSVTGFLPEDFADAAAKIVIARFADGVPAGCPETLDAASAASLPRGWVCRISGSRAVIYRRRMTSVIVR